MAAKIQRFKYTKDEIAAIEATLQKKLCRWPELRFLEDSATHYLIQVSFARGSVPRKQIKTERDNRDRAVERVRRAVTVRDRAERVSAQVDSMVANDQWLSRTRLLAQAMFDGEIDQFDLEALIVRDYLTEPGRLSWPGEERWTHPDDRKRRYRWEYINRLVCDFADERCCRPDELPVSASQSVGGNRLMDFILAAGSRPMQEAGEEIGTDRLLDIVEEIKAYWVGRQWEDPELEAVLAGESERKRLDEELDDTIPFDDEVDTHAVAEPQRKYAMKR